MADDHRCDADADIAAILALRGAQGADHWTTADRRLLKGAPFSTVECIDYLLDLGVSATDPVLAEPIGLVLAAWRADGRFQLYPKGARLPCHTAQAARLLCRAGLVADPRVQTSLDYLLASRFQQTGWRCNKFSFGRGPETEFANPHPTLVALDAFRHTKKQEALAKLDGAIEFLLGHWDTRAPLGPCHYGIGTLFGQVEYPFRSYNLFYWVYVLSHYPTARRDARFQAAFAQLAARSVDGQTIIERTSPKLARLTCFAKGRPSALATRRYLEVQANLRDDPGLVA